MLIGELAERTGVGVEALRFYERRGLVPEPPRSDAGYRLYNSDAVRQVRFILRAKELGFTLAETGELLELRPSEGAPCAQVEAKAREKLDDLDRRLRELTRIRNALRELVRVCAATEEMTGCPILDALHEGEEAVP